MNGWIVQSNTAKTGANDTSAVMVLRVPAERLEDTVERIKTNAISVDSENITGQDVTQDYVDATSRMHNLEAAEAQLRKIMEETKNTKDVLAVYDQLVEVRGEIETIKGRLNYFTESAAFSSISLTLVQKTEPTPTPTPIVTNWSPIETANRAFDSLLSTIKSVVDLLIWLVVAFLPIALAFGVPGLFIYRWWSRRDEKANESTTNN
jgi:hypothetical protein